MENQTNDSSKLKEEHNITSIQLAKTKQNLIDVENERHAMLSEHNNAQYSNIISGFQEEISVHNSEISGKSNHIVELQNSVALNSNEKFDCNILRIEAPTKLLSEALQDKEEISEYSTETKDLTLYQKLSSFVNEKGMVSNALLNSLNADQDIGTALTQLSENCNKFGYIMKLIAHKWHEQTNKVLKVKEEMKSLSVQLQSARSQLSRQEIQDDFPKEFTCDTCKRVFKE